MSDPKTRKPKAAKYKGPHGLVLVNGKPLATDAVVSGPPDVVAELCTRGDCEPIYESDTLEGAVEEKPKKKGAREQE